MRAIFLLLFLVSLMASHAHAQVPSKVYTGQFPCELSQEVTLSADFRYPGRYILQFGKSLYTVQRVPTTDGVQDVVRLEDAAKGAVWIQLPYKSMLMSQKLGKRLVDECTSTGQARVARTMAPPSDASLLSDATK
jgi:hypothetical protein